MRLLLTGDWQAEWANLDLCAQAAQDIDKYMSEYKLRGIGLLGDLKRAYNPIDTRVVLFWQNQIEYWCKHGYFVFVNLGNHDRIGQTDDQQNWLPVLQRAGAEVCDEPAIIESRKMLGDGRVFILPYGRDVEMLKSSLRDFRHDKPNPEKDLLLFHQDIRSARYNKLGVKSDAKLTVNDLYPSRYRACIGGHIHLHQKIGENVYYAGSPFCTDWGEANQSKGYVIVRDSKIGFVASSIPGWFDESWPGFRADRIAAGSKLRIHPTCDTSSDYGRTIERSRLSAERKYPGVRVFVVPEFVDQERREVQGLRPEDPDAVKIRAYVKQTAPDQLEGDERRIVNYLVRKLEKAVGHSVRSTDGIRFIKASAENFLSFKKAEFDFTKKGVTVVQGINEDWGGRSNGAGKTSLLQLLPVGLFGTTFKGQKYDRWTRRGTEGQSCVGLSFRDAKGRKITVGRQRRPTGLRLSVDGVDSSTGLRNDQRDATQGAIEQIAGFTWETFANAVYIDQAVAARFLQGTKKERSEVLAHYQNLERFEKALVLVKKDAVNCETQLQDTLNQRDSMVDRIGDAENHLAVLQDAAKTQKQVSDDRVKKAMHELKRLAEACMTASAKRTEKLVPLHTRLTMATRKLDELIAQRDAVQRKLVVSQQVYDDIREIPGDSQYCPTCLQSLKATYVKETLAKLKARVDLDRRLYEEASAKKVAQQSIVDSCSTAIEELEEANAGQLDEVDAAKLRLQRIQREEKEENKSLESANAAVADQLKKLHLHKRQYKALKKSAAALKESLEFYDYCKEAFSRDGIPRFLNEQLVPVLNRSARHYAELFTDKTIQVRFHIRHGQFEVEVINATGGEAAEDQSTGEQALVGLITSFALRSVAPKCNVLVLDEPGAGLDRGNARQFAKGLVKLSKNEGCIIVTSHNDAILGELAQERTITVIKRKGISRIY